MPAPRKHYPPAVIIQARRQYVDNRAVAEIVDTAGTNIGTLYKWLAGDVPGMDLPPIPRRRPGVRRLRPLKSMRVALVTRLWHAAEQQVREIEQRLASHAQPPSDRDRDARLLTMLVKTLRELAAMDENDKHTSAKPEPSANDASDVRDIEEFRRDLARQMDAIIASRANRASGGTETP
jgi:hypothetical protein